MNRSLEDVEPTTEEATALPDHTPSYLPIAGNALRIEGERPSWYAAD